MGRKVVTTLARLGSAVRLHPAGVVAQAGKARRLRSQAAQAAQTGPCGAELEPGVIRLTA